MLITAFVIVTNEKSGRVVDHTKLEEELNPDDKDKLQAFMSKVGEAQQDMAKKWPGPKYTVQFGGADSLGSLLRRFPEMTAPGSWKR